MFENETIEEIRRRCDLVDTVGKYVKLKRSGQNFSGSCPFHKEKTPSFSVSPSRQIFKCFGCHKSGDIFAFIQEIEGLNFPETVKQLAKLCGVEIKDTYRREPTRDTGPSPRLLEAMDWAARYYHHLLFKTKDHSSTLKYLRGRGISDATSEKFLIGVAPRGWDTLMRLMLKRGFSLEELKSAGLVTHKPETPDKCYDRFRERLMFPIRDKKGNVIAFGARILGESTDPRKYINSPESPLFSKKNTLYGIYENQRTIRLRQESLVVEGYMDVIGLYEKGVNTALATMGTALSEEHCQQLKSLCPNVVTIFDPDSAGESAWKRSIPLCLSRGLLAKDLSLPNKKDPDEFVQEIGAEKFYALCDKAPRQITKYLKEIAQRGTPSEKEKAEVLKELTPILVASRNLPDRVMIWDNISLVLNVSLDALKELCGNTPAKTAPQKTPSPQPAATSEKLLPLERDFFCLSLSNPTKFLALKKEQWLNAISNPKVAAWLGYIHEAKDQDDFDARTTKLFQTERDTELLSLATGTVFSEKPDPTQYDELLKTIHRRGREKQIQELSKLVQISAQMGDTEEQLKLLKQLTFLRSQTPA